LANEWHPDRHKLNKEEAQNKFNEINEAFEVLYNRNNKTHYDEIVHKGYSVEDAQSTFSKFFDDHDFIDE
jgi:DnaJ-class molecular chaperone